MKEQNVVSHDGIPLKYSITKSNNEKPWIVFILPFGLTVNMAKSFFDFFEYHYRVITWEARSILDASDRSIAKHELSIENHVMDVHTILADCEITSAIFVGYCSGAGIALATANRYPNLIENLILVHGEYVLLGEKDCTTQFSTEIDTLLSLAAKSDHHLSLVFDKIEQERFDQNTNRPDGIDLPFTQLNYFRRYAANYLEYKSVQFMQLAQQVSHKTFLMCGALDAQANVASTEKIKALIPNSEIYIDPQADHYGVLREESGTLIKIWNYLCEQ